MSSTGVIFANFLNFFIQHVTNCFFLDKQMFDFMRSVDTDSSGTIDLGEFTARFSVSWNKVAEGWLQEAIKEMACFLYCTHNHSIKQAFREIDADHSKKVGYKEFSKVIKSKIGPRYSKAQRRQLFDYVDADGNGSISYSEFKKAFKVTDAGVSKWEGKILEALSNFIYSNKDHIKQGFQAIDKGESGLVDIEEFKCVLQSTVDLFPKKKPLTTQQIDQLARVMKKNDKGFINWPDFLNSFVLNP